MTREEQIWDEARHRYADSKMRNAFVSAAEWAYQHPVWIPVEERLPKEEGKYMFRLSNGDMYYTTYYPKLKLHDNVTHWMEIVPPQGKEERDMDLRQVINNLKQLADYCDGVVSGNVSHKIAHLKCGIINIAELLELNAKALELGWHSASELPVIPEGKNWVKVVALVDFGDNTLRPRHEIYKDKGWSKKDMWTVKYWCYPPMEE